MHPHPMQAKQLNIQNKKNNKKTCTLILSVVLCMQCTRGTKVREDHVEMEGFLACTLYYICHSLLRLHSLTLSFKDTWKKNKTFLSKYFFYHVFILFYRLLCEKNCSDLKLWLHQCLRATSSVSAFFSFFFLSFDVTEWYRVIISTCQPFLKS